MAYSILLVVEKPAEIDFKNNQTWYDCVSTLSDLTNKNTGALLLAENVLLIPLHDTLGTLARAVLAVSKFQYRYAIFDEEIKWHKVASKV